MTIPLELCFRHMDPLETLEQAVRSKTEKLDRFSKHIIAFKVVVEAPHKHHHKGNLYHVRIDISLTGQVLIINRSPSEHHSHEDVNIAIRDAFHAANRQLEDYVQKQRDELKLHEPLSDSLL